MYKVSLELGKINNSMKLKFNVIMKDKTEKKANRKYNNRVIDRFTYNGSDYLRISPKPYITIDISSTSDKNDEWNSNSVVNLNKFCLFDMIRKVRSMINKFKIPDLFFIKNKKLHLNTEIANNNFEIIRTPNKIIKLVHAVIYDSNNQELEYEGVCFMINSPDNFCCLTYNELEYLYYVLTHIDMDTLAMSIVNSYMISNMSSKLYAYSKTRDLVIDKTIPEEVQKEIDITPLPKIEAPNEIPDDI